RERGPGLGHAAQADHALAGELSAVAAHADLFAGVGLDEGAVGAFVDERELVAARFDARVHPRDQGAFDDHVVVLGAAERGALATLSDRDLAALIAQREALGPGALAATETHRRPPARGFLALPENLEQDDFVGLAANRCDVDLPRSRLPLRRQAL